MPFIHPPTPAPQVDKPEGTMSFLDSRVMVPFWVREACEEFGPEVRLTPLFEHLGGTVNYETLRIVTTCLKNQQDE